MLVYSGEKLSAVSASARRRKDVGLKFLGLLVVLAALRFSFSISDEGKLAALRGQGRQCKTKQRSLANGVSTRQGDDLGIGTAFFDRVDNMIVDRLSIDRSSP